MPLPLKKKRKAFAVKKVKAWIYLIDEKPESMMGRMYAFYGKDLAFSEQEGRSKLVPCTISFTVTKKK